MKALGILEPRQPTAAPNVTLPTLQGRPLALSELKGKVVLVNFWATWCIPCQWEMPLMEKLYQAYKAKGFVIVAISLDQEGRAVVESFVKERKLTYPVLLDPSLTGARQFGIVGLPATFLIGADGFIKGVTYGPVCRAPIEGQGIRKGFRVFCSTAHVEKFAQDQAAWKRALSRMSNKKGGGCC
ncbi:MAG: TlpA family protein disulfide reductase [Candidatus Rokubacteria bacterium]|nr:TlpA family protein disulfide reductase [Candidatus Rokubacteria bacterium]